MAMFLPCDVGDIFYEINLCSSRIIERTVDCIKLYDKTSDSFSIVFDNYKVDSSEIGKTLFFTKAEAQAALKNHEKQQLLACRPGDTVYLLSNKNSQKIPFDIYPFEVYGIFVNKTGTHIDIANRTLNICKTVNADVINEKIFLTRELAEKKYESIKDEYEEER